MFGCTPADASPRTIALMILIAPRPMLAPNILFRFQVPS
jgi:hypothetical protein